MSRPLTRAELLPELGNECDDFDEDCAPIVDKLACWMYAPECGYCPYLIAQRTRSHANER